jgi:thiamine-monophosphate kinase
VKEIETITENRIINTWLKHFIRCPEQINKPHESDAELVEIPGNDSELLAVTIDTVSEEISRKLYQNPFTMGWVTVMASLSDLAAVGADPIGIVVAVSLEPSQDEQFRKGIAEGMNAACRKVGVYLLGGDTNTAPNCSLTGCAFGIVPKNRKMMRLGCSPGDFVFLSGRVGQGNALGLARMSGETKSAFLENLYRPQARLKEGLLIRKYASCCMDTSDGLLITLDQLSRLNHLGFIVETGWKDLLAPEVWALCVRRQIPPWYMAAGIHGEFELIFSVPSDKVDDLNEEAAETGFQPIQLGRIEHEPNLGVVLPSGKKVKMDMAPLRNLWGENEPELDLLIQQHRFFGKKWGLE